MEIDEFRKRLKEIGDEALRKRTALCREFAFANDTVRIGDIITDHIGSIRVERIDFYIANSSDFPECIYRGPMQTKSGKPFKSGEQRFVYQRNIR